MSSSNTPIGLPLKSKFVEREAKTSTKNATIRYFYTLISFLLKNVWLYLQKKHFTIVKRGPQVIDEDKFRFEMFILLIEEWLRRKLKVRLIVECLR